MMTRAVLAATVGAVAFAVLPAAAGVVIEQSVTIPDGRGGNQTMNQTVMIDGNRSKSSTPSGSTITDLERKTMTVLDPAAKTATEMPIDSFGPMMAAALVGEFKATGTKKKIAGYECEEFEHRLDAMNTKGMSRSCVSKTAPGASEAASFYRRVVEAMAGKAAAGNTPDGVTLAEETEVEPMKIPNLPPEAAEKLAETQAKVGKQTSRTLVTRIEMRSVQPSEFAVPADYKRAKVDPKSLPPRSAAPTAP